MVEKIVSGGQTGADRAALDAALELGLAVGGWVPKDRWAEDGAVPAHYPNLCEAESGDPAVRTALNVRDSDATVVLSHGKPSGGSALAMEVANRIGRSVVHIDLSVMSVPDAARQLREWLAIERPKALHVAGSRSSEDPEIFDAVKRVLASALMVRGR